MTETAKWPSGLRASGACGLGQAGARRVVSVPDAGSVPAGPASGLAPRPQTTGWKRPTTVPRSKPQCDHLGPWPRTQHLSSHHGQAPPVKQQLREGAVLLGGGTANGAQPGLGRAGQDDLCPPRARAGLCLLCHGQTRGHTRSSPPFADQQSHANEAEETRGGPRQQWPSSMSCLGPSRAGMGWPLLSG